MRIRKKQEHRCVDCGFLCFRMLPSIEGSMAEYTECTLKYRQDLAEGQPFYLENMTCFRKQWSVGQKSNYIMAEHRVCAYFLKYIPGYDPQEHKDIIHRKETTRAMQKATLMGAGIGAGAAIAAQLLYIRFAT